MSCRINSLQDYFDASMALLKPQVRQELFPAERPVLTRVRDQVPAKYGLGAAVNHSLVADGCIIEGTVENSVIFRGAKIGRGAVIRVASLWRARSSGTAQGWNMW